MQILPDRLIWDSEDFLAGFIPEHQSGSFLYNVNGAATMSSFDPFIIAPGVACVGANPTNISGTSGGGSPVPNSVLVDATLDLGGNNAYALGTDVQKFQVSPSNVFSTTAPFPHAIDHGHTNETGALGAIVFYHTPGTANVVFYSFNDDTDGSVGTYDVSIDAFNDSYLNTVPTGAAALTLGKAHPLFVTSDDKMLIGNGNKVNMYDGSTTGGGTYSTNVLNLPQGYEVVGFTEPEDGYDTWVFATTARGTTKRGRSKAFVWSIDRPASYYRSPVIPDDECSAPFSFLGTVGCFTRSRSSNARSVLRIYEGGVWVPKYYWSGELPTVGGVEIQNNSVVWNSAGTIYRWGPYAGQFNAMTWQPQSCSGTSSGFVKSFSNGTTSGLYASSGSGTSGVQTFTQFATGSWRAGQAAPPFPQGKIGKITSVQIHLIGGASGGGRTLKLGLIDDTGTLNEVFSGLSTYTSTDTMKKYLPEAFTIRMDTFVSVAPRLDWETGSGASNVTSVRKIEVFYESVDVANSQP